MWSNQNIGRHWLLEQAELLLSLILVLRARAKALFYEAVLSRHGCPSCGSHLRMIEDGLCECAACRTRFDPTLEFQRCQECNGEVIKKTYHYSCSDCGRQVRSRFTFDRRVFDKAYFAEMMQASRERKQKKREAIQEMLRDARSSDLLMTESPQLQDIPGLVESLDAFVNSPIPAEMVSAFLQRPELDLVRYESHVLASVDRDEIDFDVVDPLLDDLRLDRIFRFIAAVFLDHRRQITLRQSGDILIITKNETYCEG